jgi:hypothetical protein
MCRGCGENRFQTLLDLGESPIANDFLLDNDATAPDVKFPLHVVVCSDCGFVQLTTVADREEVFSSEYVYFSSYSDSWLQHCMNYFEMITTRLSLNKESFVVEIASNDGYLLKYFRSAGIPVLGVEPVAPIARLAEKNHGIKTIPEFFGKALAHDISSNYPSPDLIIANNVLAHVPNLHDFLEGFSIIMSTTSVATFEFPHVMNLVLEKQFDTIYHEHYSYLSIKSLIPVLAKYDLRIIDVEKIPTHGGSLRVYVTKRTSTHNVSESLGAIIKEENEFNTLDSLAIETFQNEVTQIKNNFILEVKKQKKNGMKIAAYGAAAKGNTFLNYSGIDHEYIDYVVDRNPTKQGKFLPGTKIPVVAEDYLRLMPPDIIVILPWNIANEIVQQLDYLRETGTLFMRAIPRIDYL